MDPMAQRVRHFSTTIFTEMTDLANRHGAVNLGQGFPDFAAPDFVKEAAIRALRADVNQYAPLSGLPQLRAAIATKLAQQYDLQVDPVRGVTVTHGATEAIFAAIQSLVDPGDEVIVFEPYYDSYVPSIQFAGGRPRFYTLKQPDWALDRHALSALFSDRTRLIIVNSPHNPTGKVFDDDELALIAGLCQQYDVIALCDEVYEHIIFDGRRHRPLATLPGMSGRCLTISSLGKSFSVTGWKVGWAAGPEPLVQAVNRSHQFITFSGAAPLQGAAATILETAATAGYYDELLVLYETKRDFLVDALREAGLHPITPAGTYFVMVDIGLLGFADDVAFCRFLTTEVGVAAIPPSAFYAEPAAGAALARFAFCKSEAALETAVNRLRAWARAG